MQEAEWKGSSLISSSQHLSDSYAECALFSLAKFCL